MKKEVFFVVVCTICFLLTACSFNPFSSNNHTTGNPLGAAVGAGVGAAGVASFGGSKPLIALGGIGGGMFGYYVTTLRYDAGPIITAGGQVYNVGDLVGVYIPSDRLFEPNTADLLPQARPILDSLAVVIQRFPKNNLIVSGNTSGFFHSKWEASLSERRAQVVSGYLWNAGVSSFKTPGIDLRKLMYVGYGDYFPIANTYTNDGIRANSRIQIVSYPTDCDLHLDERTVTFHNIGSMYDIPPKGYSVNRCERDQVTGEYRSSCFRGEFRDDT